MGHDVRKTEKQIPQKWQQDKEKVNIERRSHQWDKEQDWAMSYTGPQGYKRGKRAVFAVEEGQSGEECFGGEKCSNEQ